MTLRSMSQWPFWYVQYSLHWTASQIFARVVPLILNGTDMRRQNLFSGLPACLAWSPNMPSKYCTLGIGQKWNTELHSRRFISLSEQNIAMLCRNAGNLSVHINLLTELIIHALHDIHRSHCVTGDLSVLVRYVFVVGAKLVLALARSFLHIIRRLMLKK